jgi:ABC-2 type transport system permease protein
MITLHKEVWAVSRLELSEVLRSRWMLFCAGTYGVLGAGFVFVGMRESMVMGFSGMGRALMSMVHALLLLLPLLALTATAQVINRAREDGTLELLFSHPVRRSAYFLAVSLTRYTVLVVPLVVLMGALALLGRFGFGQEMSWGFLGQAMAICTGLVAAFVGLGVAISTAVRSQPRAVSWALFCWAAAVALLDFGLVALMLQWQLNPRTIFLLASLNPVQAARMALLSGASSDLTVLGPVGFYLANHLGPAALYALGVAWPWMVGLLAFGAASLSFRRADLV